VLIDDRAIRRGIGRKRMLAMPTEAYESAKWNIFAGQGSIFWSFGLWPC
jgi:hypothetical protein